MNLLAFDTACDACSVAVWRDGVIVAQSAKAMVRGQSEELVTMIDRIMGQADQSFAALTAIAVTVGPGAFTGLRIGLATARALALAADRPAIGVTTVEAIAAAAAAENGDRSRGVVVAIDTKRGDLYLQSFMPDASILGFSPWHEAAVLAPAAALALLPPGPLLLAGDGARQLLEAMSGSSLRATLAEAKVPDAASVAAVAARRYASTASQPPLRPLYLRPPAARLPPISAAGMLP